MSHLQSPECRYQPQCPNSKLNVLSTIMLVHEVSYAGLVMQEVAWDLWSMTTRLQAGGRLWLL